MNLFPIIELKEAISRKPRKHKSFFLIALKHNFDHHILLREIKKAIKACAFVLMVHLLFIQNSIHKWIKIFICFVN